jgi:hypothetical protein
MAESSENKTHTMDKLSDELDSMLDDKEASIEQQDELIDDEDAIDRLLMDNAFDSPDEEEPDEFAEIDELISEGLADSDNQSSNEIEGMLDDFADDEGELMVAMDETDTEKALTSEPEVDEFVDADEEDATIATTVANVNAGKNQEAKDEFAELESNNELQNSDEMDGMNEIDEFTDVKVEQDSSNDQPNEQEDLMVDFDISADDDSAEQIEPYIEQAAETTATERSVQAEVKEIPQTEQNEAAFAEVNAQLAALQNVQESMKLQIADMGSKDDMKAFTDELNGLDSEQKKIKRKIKAVEEKKPVFAYAALAIAIIALLIGSGLGMVGFGADSKVSELSESVVNIEDELEVFAEKFNPEKMNALTNRLDSINSEVATNSAQIAAIKKAVGEEAFLNQPETENLGKQLAQLGEQNMQMGAALEALQLQVEKMENKRQAAKVTRKKPVIKEKWAVNLISFKQEWYAKRKAAEFDKKGIPVIVMKVVIKGDTWYRLRVKGFKSKNEAAAYAAKVKKSLNLTSVWVTKD